MDLAFSNLQWSRIDWGMSLRSGATVEVLRNYDHMNDWVLEYFLRDDRLTFPCELVDSKCIFTADPDNVEHILKTNFENYPKV